jgi:hypothetical protein
VVFLRVVARSSVWWYVESISWLNEMFMSWLSQMLPPVARSFIAYLGDTMGTLLFPLILWFALYVAIRHGPYLISRPPPDSRL